MVTEELPSRARTGSPALPTGYAEALREIEAHVVAARSSAARAVNAELLGLYHRIGRVILERQRVEGWGAQVIEHLSRDLRATFPTMQGFSRSNLEYMRRLAVAVEETSFPPQLVGELAWGHVRALLDRTAVGGERRFYAEQAARHGWSRAVLTHQMATDLYRRHGNAPTNFPAVLPAVDSDLAQEITRDAYNLEFLRLEPGFRERELEGALIEQFALFLAELGTRFAGLGRQHRLEVDSGQTSCAGRGSPWKNRRRFRPTRALPTSPRGRCPARRVCRCARSASARAARRWPSWPGAASSCRSRVSGVGRTRCRSWPT